MDSDPSEEPIKEHYHARVKKDIDVLANALVSLMNSALIAEVYDEGGLQSDVATQKLIVGTEGLTSITSEIGVLKALCDPQAVAEGVESTRKGLKERSAAAAKKLHDLQKKISARLALLEANYYQSLYK